MPFAIADATCLTEAGYVGEDVENILLRLIQAADWDIPRAERGIIYIDEIDKIARKGSNPSITRDVSGEGVQQALLKIIEGSSANVPSQGGRKHPYQEFIQIKTDNILFICGGAFEGLDKIVSRRTGLTSSLGFKAARPTGGDEPEAIDRQRILDYMIPDDLLEFGLIPEFVGRLPVACSLDPLTQESLVRILTEPKNALTKQYQRLPPPRQGRARLRRRRHRSRRPRGHAAQDRRTRAPHRHRRSSEWKSCTTSRPCPRSASA